MNNVIEKVLEEVADNQINLKSEFAREMLAQQICDALLTEIELIMERKKKKNKG